MVPSQPHVALHRMDVMRLSATWDLPLFLLSYVVGCWLSAYTHATFLSANLLTLGLPSLGLVLRRREVLTRIHPFFFTLLFLFSCWVFGYLNELYGGWFVPSVFGFRIAGLAVEEIVFAFLALVFTITAYEAFVRDRRHPAPERPTDAAHYAAIGMVLLFCLGVVGVVVPTFRSLFSEYVYLKTACLFSLGPIALGLYSRPAFFKEMIKIVVLSVPIITLLEVLGLRRQYWSFPGDYIGQVSMFAVTFPTEELLFFIILGWPSIAAVQSIFEEGLWLPSRARHHASARALGAARHDGFTRRLLQMVLPEHPHWRVADLRGTEDPPWPERGVRI